MACRSSGSTGLVLASVIAALLTGCPPAPPPPGPPPPPPPADGGGRTDAGPDDEDAGVPDAGPKDRIDAGTGDGGAVDAGVPDAGPSRPYGSFPPVQQKIPRIELRIASSDLRKMNDDPYADVFYPATMVWDGSSAPAKLRYRGASTRRYPQKGFKIQLDPGYEFEDRDHFELLAQWLDPAKLGEKFATDLFFAIGAEAPRTQYVRVSINGEDNGLYVEMEHVGKDYLKHHGLEKGASIYRCGGRNCELTLQPGPHQLDFEKKTNELVPRDDLDALLRFLNRTDDPDFERRLGERIDLDRYLLNVVGDVLVSNSIVEDSSSYWVHELGRDRWVYVPWDLNNAHFVYDRDWELHWNPVVDRYPMPFSVYDSEMEALYLKRLLQDPEHRPTWNVLNTRLWDRPELRARILAGLRRALEEVFTEEKACAHIDALWKRIESQMATDPYLDEDNAEISADFYKNYIRGRRAYLLSMLDDLERHGSGALVIDAVDPEGQVIELKNRGATELRLGGLTITPDLREPARHRFPTSLKIPANGSLRLHADGESGSTHLPFELSTAGGELGIFVDGKIHSPLDVVYFGPRAGTELRRVPTGTESFEARAVSGRGAPDQPLAVP